MIALIHLQDSLDNISEQLNEGYSKAFFKFFKEKLDLSANRGYITYIDPGRENMGYISKRVSSFVLAHVPLVVMMEQPLPRYSERSEGVNWEGIGNWISVYL